MLPTIEKLICPLCGGKLTLEGRTVKCVWKHSFDFAKQGYLNLLLANQKHSKDPGDGALMIQARRAFHKAGHYKPLAEFVSNYIKAEASVLDLGCGEGSYAAWLLEKHPGLQYYGADISRHGIKAAAGQIKSATFIVASNFNLPLVKSAFDVLLTIFAPAAQEELQRLCGEEGRWINITPGNDHLRQLRAALYDEVAPIEKQTNFDGWQIETEERLSYEVQLNPEDISNLVTMTPYAWQASEEKREALLGLDELKLNIDFKLSIYSPERVDSPERIDSPEDLNSSLSDNKSQA